MSETIDSEVPAEGVNAALTAWLSISQPVEAATHQLETTLSERHAICLSAYEILTYLADRRGWTPLADISKGSCAHNREFHASYRKCRREGWSCGQSFTATAAPTKST